MALPLDGVRIVSLGVSISGPVGLRHLADFGAEVLKVEVPARATWSGSGTMRSSARGRCISG